MKKKLVIVVTLENPSKKAEEDVLNLLKAQEIEILVDVYNATVESKTFIYKSN